jgi:WD40 repeat protein
VVVHKCPPHYRRVSALAVALEGKVRTLWLLPWAGAYEKLMQVWWWPMGIKVLVSAGWDGVITCSALETGRESHRVKGDPPVNCLAIHPDQRRLAYGTWAGVCHLYDLLEQKELWAAPSTPSFVSVRAVAFTPDGRSVPRAVPVRASPW